MTPYRSLRTITSAWFAVVLLSQSLLAEAPVYVDPETKIPIALSGEDVELRADGQLSGAMVDVNGQPIVDAMVLLGHQGKAVTWARTDAQGVFAFSFKDLKPGVYQVVSQGKAGHYHIWPHQAAPLGAKQGIIHVAKRGVDRGQDPTFFAKVLSNPVLILGITAASIGIPVAIDGTEAKDAS